jgi:hypothetical protein
VDSVVVKQVQAPPGKYWVTYRACLGDDALRARIDSLRPPTASREVTTLRLLDVATWMRGSDSENAKAARRRCGLA